jgi:hypothetical protein
MQAPSCCSEWFAKCKRLHWSKKTTRIMTLDDDDGGGGGDDDDDDDYQYYYYDVDIHTGIDIKWV